MDILVNGQKIEVALDDEHSAGEVFEGLASWLNQGKMLVTELKIDGKQVDIDDTKSWGSQSVTAVKTFEVMADHIYDIRANHLHLLLDYAEHLEKAATDRTAESLEALAQSAESFEESIKLMIEGILMKRDESSSVANLIATVLADNPDSAAAAARLSDLASNLKVVLLSRIREIADPGRELSATILTLQRIIPTVSDISLLLQTGKEREALGILMEFTELTSKFIRIIPFAGHQELLEVNSIQVDGLGIDSFTQELNKILQELISGFENKDFVLIGDLLEYEITPKILSLLTTVSGLLEPQ